jgi:hypothetical protein
VSSWDVVVSAAEMADARADAEALMVDTFAAYSPGPPVTGADGMESPSWIPEGTTKAKVRGNSLIAHDTSVRMVVVGLVERPVLDGAFHIPISAPMPSIGWEYVCTAAHVSTDPALVGTRWHVVNVPVESHATARRLDVVRL